MSAIVQASRSAPRSESPLSALLRAGALRRAASVDVKEDHPLQCVTVRVTSGAQPDAPGRTFSIDRFGSRGMMAFLDKGCDFNESSHQPIAFDIEADLPAATLLFDFLRYRCGERSERLLAGVQGDCVLNMMDVLQIDVDDKRWWPMFATLQQVFPARSPAYFNFMAKAPANIEAYHHSLAELDDVKKLTSMAHDLDYAPVADWLALKASRGDGLDNWRLARAYVDARHGASHSAINYEDPHFNRLTKNIWWEHIDGATLDLDGEKEFPLLTDAQFRAIRAVRVHLHNVSPPARTLEVLGRPVAHCGTLVHEGEQWTLTEYIATEVLARYIRRGRHTRVGTERRCESKRAYFHIDDDGDLSMNISPPNTLISVTGPEGGFAENSPAGCYARKSAILRLTDAAPEPRAISKITAVWFD